MKVSRRGAGERFLPVQLSATAPAATAHDDWPIGNFIDLCGVPDPVGAMMKGDAADWPAF
jgi:hypothetical protein